MTGDIFRRKAACKGQEEYMVRSQVSDLSWVDFDLDVLSQYCQFSISQIRTMDHPVGHSVVFIPEQVFLEKFGLLTMANYYLIPMDSH